MTSNTWIDVREQLPEDGRDVLVWASGYVVIATYVSDNRWLESDMEIKRTPTHWMPLPPAPKVE